MQEEVENRTLTLVVSGTKFTGRMFKADPVFQNNVILTKTESLTMNSRPKDPKTARNKNVLVIGGSGSGKTRFWLKPNLMQMHSSLCRD